MSFFAKEKKTPVQQAREWASSVRKEKNRIQREVDKLNRELTNTKNLIKGYAKKQDMDSCKVMAKQTVRLKRDVTKLLCVQAQLGSLEMQIQSQISHLRLAQAVQASTDVMQILNSLDKVRETQHIARELNKQMIKAGILDEMIDEAIMPEEELDSDLEAETQKVIDEVVKDIFTTAHKVPAIPVKQPETSTPVEDIDFNEMEEKLKSLRQV